MSSAEQFRLGKTWTSVSWKSRLTFVLASFGKLGGECHCC